MLLDSIFDGTTYYLDVDTDGDVYMNSKEEKPGFVLHINEATKQPCGYRKKYYRGFFGYLNSIKIATRNGRDGKSYTSLFMSFRDYELKENYAVSFNLKNNNKLHRYVKSFAKICPNLDYRRPIHFNAMKRKPGDKYAPTELRLSYADDIDDKMIDFYYKKGVNGWPDVTEVEGLDGEKERNYRDQDNFAYKVLQGFIEKFNRDIPSIREEILAKMDGGSTNNIPSAPKQYVKEEPKNEAPQPVPSAMPFKGSATTKAADPAPKQPYANVPSVDEDSDLPF